jgi:RNA polymerase sigma-70 factor (ECF subfamily)
VSALAFDATIGPGEDRYLLVSVTMEGTASPIRAASFAGASLGFIGAASAPASGCRLEWWGLAAPPAGAHPFQIEAAGPTSHLEVTLISYTGVAGLGSIGAFVPASGDTGPSLLAVPSAAGEVVLDGVCGWAPDSVLAMAGPEQEARWHWSTGSLSSAGSQKDGADSVTLSWTASGPGRMEWAAAAVSLRPVGSRVSVDLGVRTAGCLIAATPAAPGPGGALAMLGMLGLWGALRSRDRGAAGTFAGGSRGTRSEMRSSTSRAAPSRVPDAQPDLDELTLARAKAGDQAARAAIVHRYQRPVFSLLWRMVGPHQAVVEDLTQETFLRVLRALDRFEHDDGRARMVTWILSIASRLAIDHLRAGRSRSDTAMAPGALPVTLPRPDHEASRRALAVALVRAVETLPPPFRAAFLLREVHGLSYNEIGLALSIDVGTVKSRLARARAALQAALAEMHDE